MIRRLTSSADPDESPELEAFGREVRDRIRSGFGPPPGTVARVEARVVSAFRAAAVERLPAGAPEPEPEPGRRTAFATRLRASWRWRVLAFAAALAVMTTSVTMAAQTSPGRPLFGARLALEAALLPGAAAPSRVDAQLDRLARRVAEVTDAVRDGDGGAAAAAARAYRETLGDLRDLVRRHPERTAAVRRALGDQIRALEAVAGRASGEAGETVQAGGVGEAGEEVSAAIRDALTVRRSLVRSLVPASWGRIRTWTDGGPPAERSGWLGRS